MILLDFILRLMSVVELAGGRVEIWSAVEDAAQRWVGF